MRNKLTVWAGGLAALSVLVTGCGSSDSDEGTKTSTRNVTGTFYSSNPIPVQSPSGQFVNIGHSFVKLANGVPQAVGLEVTDASIAAQPPTEVTDEGPNVYFIQLPPEAEATCFKMMAMFFFTAHPIDAYRPNGEPKHMHSVFLLNAPAQPSAGLVTELKYPETREIPPGIPRGVPDTVVPGVGVSYDDPIRPPGQPARITIGQNFLYRDGHMNGMVLGENISFLESHETFTDPIPQPEVYARVGYYPTRCTIRWDSKKKVHVFEMTEFIFVGEDKVFKK